MRILIFLTWKSVVISRLFLDRLAYSKRIGLITFTAFLQEYGAAALSRGMKSGIFTGMFWGFTASGLIMPTMK